jgi:uncharacterized membrane protein
MSNIPRTINGYLQQLYAALQGADPALIQDALYDAEEHLRAELAEHPELGEAVMIARIYTSYGAPEEVADIYRVKEGQVQQALRTPRAPPRASTFGKFFSVLSDTRAYTALFYMLLSLVTGIFYFVWTITGLSLSLGFMVLIIGIPFAILFFGSVRALALVEGRLVEAMLDVRMPRRPLYTEIGQPIRGRIKTFFTDPRSWSTLIYMLLMLPLGIVYFVLSIFSLSMVISLIFGPIIKAITGVGIININDVGYAPPLWAEPFTLVAGIVLLCGVLHMARGIGHLHGQLAKHMLVMR